MVLLDVVWPVLSAGVDAMDETIVIPVPSLVVLIGPSGSGKTTFARRHFLPTEVVSSDHCRALVSDDEDNQRATQEAFDVLHAIVDNRLSLRRLTVVDATNLQPKARLPLVEMARRHECPLVSIVFSLPEPLCQERNLTRLDRQVESHVVQEHYRLLQRTLPSLEGEGFGLGHVFNSPREADVYIERQQ